jgi:hypothetical protein
VAPFSGVVRVRKKTSSAHVTLHLSGVMVRVRKNSTAKSGGVCIYVFRV